MALARVGFRHAGGDDRAAAERERGVRRRRRRPCPPWPSRVPVPTMPGPIAQTATSYALRLRPGQRRPDGDALDVPAEARADRDRDGSISAALLQRAHRVGQRRPAAHRPRAGRRRPATPASAAQTGRAGCAASSTRPACRRATRRAGRPPRHAARRPGPACTAASSRARPSSAASPRPRVRFAYRTSKPPEPSAELARLRVDEHLVAERDRPGQPRVGDARRAVDLDPRQPLVPLRARRSRCRAGG